MASYPESCFTGLIGIHGTCEPKTGMFYLDTIPGIDLVKLSNVAEASAPTGEKLGVKLIESAASLMAADVEAIYDAQYKVQNTLVGGCSACKFTGNYSTGPQNGILIKNNTESNFASLILDKLVAKINAAGTYDIIITDGITSKTISQEFEAGVEYEIINIKFSTKQKSIKVYLDAADVPLAKLSCPRSSSSGCGCGGQATVVNDLVYTGLTNGVETQNAYGFMPCAIVACDAADLLCFIANSAPRMIGMALLYKAAELYFQTRIQSARNNRTTGVNVDDAKEDAKKYGDLYTAKLTGKGTRGVKDLVFTTLQQQNDVCVVCNSLITSAWATG